MVVDAVVKKAADKKAKDDARRGIVDGPTLEPASETGAFGGMPRQKDALRRAAAALDGIGAAARAEHAAAAVREALNALGEITGETATEELLDRIFSTFCVGK